MKKHVKVSKAEEYEVQLEMVDLECTRLRRMLDQLLSAKNANNPPEYAEMERKLLIQNVMLKELEKKNGELSKDLDAKIKENNNLKEYLKESEEPGTKAHDAVKKKQQIANYKEKIAEMSIEIAELKSRLAKPDVEDNVPKEVKENTHTSIKEEEKKDETREEEFKKKEEEMRNEIKVKEALNKRLKRENEEHKKANEEHEKEREQLNDKVKQCNALK
eukprot:TRINITY_DN6884_c0_g1_i8.p1 TRINITY_DN6884_c0_g1~~TRINITY_DN6884_c0_g1_i8.p1  ORF type:complete len:218 (-),score=100.43 TRINITY_DN6884_c0_g1_i8:1085-1738(-)